MEKRSFNKYYRVFTDHTVVTEVSFNDFKPPIVRKTLKEISALHSGNKALAVVWDTYSLLPEKDRYYGYLSKSRALKMAKVAALKVINKLIAEGPASDFKVYQYRFDHYDDLNFNLIESAIRIQERLESKQYD